MVFLVKDTNSPQANLQDPTNPPAIIPLNGMSADRDTIAHCSSGNVQGHQYMKHTKEHLDNLRHSAAHLLAAAVVQLWPDAKRTIGPSIENGFYYDFDFGGTKLSEDDLSKIEETMHQIAKTWDTFIRHEVTKDDALAEFADNEYKQELIQEFAQDEQQLTIYQSGEFRDLCRGGHVENPSEVLKHFKLLSVAGAYWRGDENNKMLTRIYGTAFETKEELDNYLWQQEEAKRRDHRKLGQDLGLFLFHETSPGAPYWLPNGLVIYNQLIDFWRQEHKERGYQEIASPLINKKELWEISGHWDHYKNDMFIADMGENEVYGLKPMNCPNAMIVYGSKLRSYRELPLRLSDTDTLHRYERSGTLNGLLRVRMFRQDDSHNFITEDMIEDEYAQIFDIANRFYGIFGLDFKYRLGTRPEKFMGDMESWEKAEAALHSILTKTVGKEGYYVEEGDGAFYGPKVDIVMKDALGRDWQMGTIQLDFQIPKRFDLKYIDSDGSEKMPIVVHRVIYGSLERFIGIIIEHFAGAFPVWLAPVQVKIIPVGADQYEFAHQVHTQLLNRNIRAEEDVRGESLNARIRAAQLEKVPYMLIIGKREVENNTVSVRLRTGEDLGELSIDDLQNRILEKITTKALDL